MGTLVAQAPRSMTSSNAMFHHSSSRMVVLLSKDLIGLMTDSGVCVYYLLVHSVTFFFFLKWLRLISTGTVLDV